MIAATCHCGAIHIHVSRAPRTVTRCNHAWRRKVRTYFRCKRCGCVTHYKYRKRGRGYPVAVNARNFDPEVLAAARIRNLDGASTWTWEYAP